MACPSGRTGTRPTRQSVALGACASTADLGLYRRRLRSSAAPTGGSVDDAWPEPRARRCRVRRGSGLFYPPCHRPGPGCFPRPGVAVPTEQGEAAAQFTLFARLFVLVPVRAGFRAMLVVGVGVFMDAPPQRVVGVVDAECVVFKAHQAVEQVPTHLALLAVLPTVNINPYRLSF